MQELRRIYTDETSDRTQHAKVARTIILVVPSRSRNAIHVSVLRCGAGGVNCGAALCYNLKILTRSGRVFKCFSLVHLKFLRDF